MKLYKPMFLLACLASFPCGASDKSGKLPIPREVVKDHGQKPDIHKADSQNKNAAAPHSIEENQKTGTEPTEQDKRESQRIAISPIDINSIKIGPLDVRKDWADYGFLIFSALLVVVGFLQVLVYWRQAGYMRQGLEQNRITANAAQTNANTATHQTEIIAAGQRPWIMVKPENKPLQVSGDRAGPLIWQAINVGNGPALLHEIAIDLIVMPYPFPNVRPVYPTPDKFAKFLIPPNGSHAKEIERLVNGAEVQDIVSGVKCVVLYGFVKYEGSIGDSYETRFCCYWYSRNSKWWYEPVGPPDWVDYT